MDIEKSNELITKFMGWTKGHPDKSELRWADDWFVPMDQEHLPEDADWQTRNTHLLFRYKWGWLMPVVRKIVQLCIDNGITGDGELFMSEQYTSILDTVSCAVIEDAYKVVVEFIEFYNTLNK